MEFTRTDIYHLYGDMLFTLPKEGAVANMAAKDGATPAKEPVPPIAIAPAATPSDTPVHVAVKEPPVPREEARPKPAPVPVSAPEKVAAPLAKIVWKLRPTSRYALVLHEAEFSRKLLTSALKAFVEAAGIPTAEIGFGVLPDASAAWDFSDTPLNIVSVLMLTPAPAQPPAMPAGKRIFFGDLIVAAVNDAAKEKQLAAALQAMK